MIYLFRMTVFFIDVQTFITADTQIPKLLAMLNEKGSKTLTKSLPFRVRTCAESRSTNSEHYAMKLRLNLTVVITKIYLVFKCIKNSSFVV